MNELTDIQTRLRVPKTRECRQKGKDQSGRPYWFTAFNYRNAEDILNAVKPLLLETHCTLYLSDAIEATPQGVYIRATATIANAQGEAVSANGYAREDAAGKWSGSQATGSASSYARKYALCGLFLIDDNADADSIEAAHNRAEERAAQAPAATAAPQTADPTAQEVARATAQIEAAADSDTLDSIVRASRRLWSDTAFAQAVKRRREQLAAHNKQQTAIHTQPSPTPHRQ